MTEGIPYPVGGELEQEDDVRAEALVCWLLGVALLIGGALLKSPPVLLMGTLGLIAALLWQREPRP